MKTDPLVTVRCPACEAEAGVSCFGGLLHSARIDAYQLLQQRPADLIPIERSLLWYAIGWISVHRDTLGEADLREKLLEAARQPASNK